jgi:pimeloyl-ACP methyl ester carboxylesterase
VQRGHRDAAQLGLGDIQAQVGADVDQPPGLARQEVTGVVAGVEEPRPAGEFLPALPPRGHRRRDRWPCCRICRGQDAQVAAPLMTGDQVMTGDQAGVLHQPGQRRVRPRDQFRALAGILDVGRCVPEPGRFQAGAGHRPAAAQARPLRDHRAEDSPERVKPGLMLAAVADYGAIEGRMTGSSEFIGAPWRYERLDGAGHWLQWEAPDEVNRLLLDFLTA